MLGGFVFILPMLFVMGNPAFMLGDFSADYVTYDYLPPPEPNPPPFPYPPPPPDQPPLPPQLPDYPSPPLSPDYPPAPPLIEHFDSSNAAVNIFIYAVGRTGESSG